MSAALRCFLMSDLESSSHLWATQADAMGIAVTLLDAEVDAAVRANDGELLKARGEGDSHFAVFALPSDAVLCATALQTRLSRPVGRLDLCARISVHTGEIDEIGGDYYGVAVNQTARLRAIAHGGQTLLSSVTALLAGPMLRDRLQLHSLGHHRIRDFPRLEEVFQALPLGQVSSFPALRTAETHGPALLAVAMVDICGADAVLRDLSDSGVASVQNEWASSMRKFGDSHNAWAVKLLGDGCIAAFEDPLDCLAFAQSFRAWAQAEGFDAKAGLDVGRVGLADGEIIGSAVYRSYRLRRGAGRGEIAVSQLMRELVGLNACGGSPDRLDSSTDLASAP